MRSYGLYCYTKPTKHENSFYLHAAQNMLTNRGKTETVSESETG